MRYAIVVERVVNNYSAYVPDLPGCFATGATMEETEQLIREAIELHLTGLREDGLPINSVPVSLAIDRNPARNERSARMQPVVPCIGSIRIAASSVQCGCVRYLVEQSWPPCTGFWERSWPHFAEGLGSISRPI